MTRLLLIVASLWALPLAAAPLYTLPAPSPEQLSNLDQPTSGAQHLGYVLPMVLDARHDGVWQQQGEWNVWSARIHAQGARGLSLQFEQANLPDDARLEISAPGRGSMLVYSSEQIRDGRLYTAQLPGDTLQLRLSTPADAAAALRLARVNVAYRQPRAKSGSCNIDTACNVAQTHDDKVRSTVLLVYPVGSGSLIACSGVMLNNARQDLAPYLLTADHCEIDETNADSLQVYWKYEDSACDGSNNGSPGPVDPAFGHVGATFLADGFNADFTLLLIGTPNAPFVPPANYEPFWAGWELSTTPAQCGTGVHHPNGDQKAISFFNTPLRAATAEVEGRFPAVWEVFWDQGTTEQGSSGSGLWNEFGQVVGVLSGGEASCGFQQGVDYYARLNAAWEFESAPAGQLKHWLDPDDSGTTSIGGANLDGPVAASSAPNCTSNGSPSPTPAPTPTPRPSSSGSGALGGWLFVLLAALHQLGFRRRAYAGRV